MGFLQWGEHRGSSPWKKASLEDHRGHRGLREERRGYQRGRNIRDVDLDPVF